MVHVPLSLIKIEGCTSFTTKARRRHPFPPRPGASKKNTELSFIDSAKGKIFNLKKEISKSHHKSLACEWSRGKSNK